MKTTAFILALTTTCAHAEFMDGNELFQRLREATPSQVALAYIAGAHDAGRGVLHCSPPNATLLQIRDMVLQTLTANPDRRHLTADLLISATLQAAWPCPKSSTPRNNRNDV